MVTVGAAGPGGGVIDRPTTAKPGIGEKCARERYTCVQLPKRRILTPSTSIFPWLLLINTCQLYRSTTKKKRPPIYRVMLHNDSFNRRATIRPQGCSRYHQPVFGPSVSNLDPAALCRREYVVQILLKVIDGLTMADAVNVMQVSPSPACCQRSSTPIALFFCMCTLPLRSKRTALVLPLGTTELCTLLACAESAHRWPGMRHHLSPGGLGGSD